MRKISRRQRLVGLLAATALTTGLTMVPATPSSADEGYRCIIVLGYTVKCIYY